MKKKFFLAISTVMMLGLLAGCGKETDTNSNASTVASAGTTTTNGTSAETTVTNEAETVPTDPGQELAISTEQYFIEGENFGPDDKPYTVTYHYEQWRDPHDSTTNERHDVEAEVIYHKGEGSVSISKTVNLLNDLAQKQGYTEVDFTTMTVDEFKEWFNDKFDVVERANGGNMHAMVIEQSLLDALSMVPDLNKNYTVVGGYNDGICDMTAHYKNDKGEDTNQGGWCMHIYGFEEVVPTETATPTPTPYEALY